MHQIDIVSTILHMHPVQTEIILGILTDLDQSLLDTFKITQETQFLYRDREDFDQIETAPDKVLFKPKNTDTFLICQENTCYGALL